MIIDHNQFYKSCPGRAISVGNPRRPRYPGSAVPLSRCPIPRCGSHPGWFVLLDNRYLRQMTRHARLAWRRPSRPAILPSRAAGQPGSRPQFRPWPTVAGNLTRNRSRRHHGLCTSGGVLPVIVSGLRFGEAAGLRRVSRCGYRRLSSPMPRRAALLCSHRLHPGGYRLTLWLRSMFLLPGPTIWANARTSSNRKRRSSS